MLLPQTEVNYITVMEDDLYMFPRTDGILLGGLFQEGEWSLSVDETTKSRVLKGHAQFFGNFRRRTGASLKDFQLERSIRNELLQPGRIMPQLAEAVQ